jgi:hypothetical protein
MDGWTERRKFKRGSNNVATLLFSLLFCLRNHLKHYGMNDIKEEEHLPIVPLTTLLLSRLSGRMDGRTRVNLNPPF